MCIYRGLRVLFMNILFREHYFQMDNTLNIILKSLTLTCDILFLSTTSIIEPILNLDFRLSFSLV